MREITSKCNEKNRVLTNVWNVFQILLEKCEPINYKFLVNEVAKANELETEKVRQACDAQI